MTTRRFIETVAASGLVDESTKPAFDRIVEPWTGSEAAVDQSLLDALAAASIVTPWQASQLLKGRYKGFFLGKYRLLRLLGTGGMSSVYEAEHATLGHHVAIKVLPLKRAERTSFLERFNREARASARLNHPNLARVSDIDAFNDVHFMVMEYVDGVDLHKRVKEQGSLPIREAVDLIRQAARGLEYAHEEGFVHRDVKPANMILDRRGTLKVLDLGLALPNADQDRQASLTHEHDEKVLGTADYLAPEQAKDSHVADKRSDIYSLGCTLFFLLTGRGPFSGGSIAERIRRHINDPPPNLLDLRPDVPAPIVEVVYRMMEKHPDARYQSAGEVADLLTAWLAATQHASSRGTADRTRPSRDALRRQPAGSASTGSPPAPRRHAQVTHAPLAGFPISDPSSPGGASSPSGSHPPFTSTIGPMSSSPTSDVHEFVGQAQDSFLEPSLSSVLVATPSPQRSDRSTITDPLALNIDAGPSGHPRRPASGRARRRSNPLGIPWEAWVMIGVGLLVAAVLGAVLLMR